MANYERRKAEEAAKRKAKTDAEEALKKKRPRRMPPWLVKY